MALGKYLEDPLLPLPLEGKLILWLSDQGKGLCSVQHSGLESQPRYLRWWQCWAQPHGWETLLLNSQSSTTIGHLALYWPFRVVESTMDGAPNTHSEQFLGSLAYLLMPPGSLTVTTPAGVAGLQAASWCLPLALVCILSVENAQIALSKDLPDHTCLSSLTINGTKRTRKLQGLLCIQVHSAPASRAVTFCLFLGDR